MSFLNKLFRSSSSRLFEAIQAGDLARVQALVKRHSNLVSSKDQHGLTPLHWAVEAGQRSVAALLLANKAQINGTDVGGRTPLHRAAEKGQKDMAELLLANDADVNATVTKID